MDRCKGLTSHSLVSQRCLLRLQDLPRSRPPVRQNGQQGVPFREQQGGESVLATKEPAKARMDTNLPPSEQEGC